ncbi:MAG: hypothetical protein Q4B64_08975 [Spirochaetales bacterium]|nr:hypothetical protein [Spirochaetales bacterium]
MELKYVEPASYFTKEMLEILERTENNSSGDSKKKVEKMKDEIFYLVLKNQKTGEYFIEKHTESEIHELKFTDVSAVGKCYTEEDAKARKQQCIEFDASLKKSE